MPKPSEIIEQMVAPLQNDAAGDEYNVETCLDYFNMALRALQEEFELNSIPVTEETNSAPITVPLGTTIVAFGGNPGLPANLIEINRLWESPSGQEIWTPMAKKDYIPQYMRGVEYAQFRIWAWIDNSIHLLSCTQNNDLKLNYIKSLFPTVTEETAEDELGTRFVNCFQYLGFKTAAYCSMFIGENETRAIALDKEANDALSRSLGISIKGTQSIQRRRRPFRFAYKMTRGLGGRR